MHTADRFCDLAGFHPDRLEPVVYAHDGSCCTLIEVDGTRTIVSDEEADDVAEDRAAVVDRPIEGDAGMPGKRDAGDAEPAGDDRGRALAVADDLVENRLDRAHWMVTGSRKRTPIIV